MTYLVELDALVAEKVMGWKRDSKNPGAWIPPGMKPLRNAHYTAKPGQFTTDPAADYEVLKHVRETWDSEHIGSWLECLGEMWVQRTYLNANWVFQDLFPVYEPGDYSKAALKTLGEDE